VGNAVPEAEQGLNMGRLISLMGLKTDDVPGVTVNRYCASGLETIAIATAIKLALYPFIFLMISAQNIKSIGTTATKADKAMLLNGLMTCVQFIFCFVLVVGIF
jgi:acetyl-CoA acetyltransferase